MPSFGTVITWLLGTALVAFFIVALLSYGGFFLFDVRMHELMKVCVNAGSSQSIVVYNPYIEQKAPILVNDNALNAAQSTWNENVTQWGQGPWSAVEPQFSLSSIKSGTPLGDDDTIDASVQVQYPFALLNNFLVQFGVHQAIQQTITVQEQASAHVPAP